MTRHAKHLWRWSWLATLPVTIVFIYWGWMTFERYTTFGMRYNPGPIKVSLLDSGKIEFFQLLRRMELSVFPPRHSSHRPDHQIRTINLFVSEADLAQLNSHLPYSGYEYVKAGLWNGNKLRKVKVKYRGDFVYHWSGHKKSLRVKTKKNRLFEGMRSFNLIVPKFPGQLNNHLGYRLASIMGLIAPRTEMVNVVLNGKKRGVHVLVEQLEELTLRNLGRMPGDIYAGELIAKDAYSGANNQVFEHPGLWDKIAVNNHYPLESRKPLIRLLALINGDQSEKAQIDLSELVDIESWGRFSAFETLVQTIHYDTAHNWRLYYDPWRTRFEPIVWDPTAWHPNWLPKNGKSAQLDFMPSQLHQMLFKNAGFLRARQDALDEFFTTGQSSRFLAELDSIATAMEDAIEGDPFYHFLSHGVISGPKEKIAAMRKLAYDIREVFSDIEGSRVDRLEEVTYIPPNNGGPWRLSVSGRRPVTELQFDYVVPLQSLISAHIRYWSNGEAMTRDISAAVSMNGRRLILEVPLIPRYRQIVNGKQRLKTHDLQTEPGYYELLLEGIPSDNQLIELGVRRGNRRNQTVPARQVNELPMQQFEDVFTIVPPRPLNPPVVWENDVRVSGILEIDDDLIIKPGTTVKLGPGASIILRGRLIAEGTPERRIRFLPDTEGQAPWGVLALKGNGADNSRLIDCEISGGSGLKDDLYEYSAMFSVHDVANVNVRNCSFSDNRIVDDMVHTVYADIRFRNTEFLRSFADALDLDITGAVIENCRFDQSGNDAVDLMTTKAVVVDSTLENSGDKGISVGENSRLLAINNQIVGNGIGVQTKDGSVAVLYNVVLSRNKHALDAYKKNWRYNNGGSTFVYKSRIFGNERLITADKKSGTWIYDSYLDQNVTNPGKQISLDETVDFEDTVKPRNSNKWRLPLEKERLGDFGDAYWAKANAMLRGATEIDN